MGWFFGFKLHVVINHKGELMAVNITPGNSDDRKPLDAMTENLTGRLRKRCRLEMAHRPVQIMEKQSSSCRRRRIRPGNPYENSAWRSSTTSERRDWKNGVTGIAPQYPTTKQWTKRAIQLIRSNARATPKN